MKGGTQTQVTWKRGLAHRTAHTSARASKDNRTLALTEVLTDAAHMTRNKAWPGHCHSQTKVPGDATHSQEGLCLTIPQPSSRVNQSEPQRDQALRLCLLCALYTRERKPQTSSPDCCLAMHLGFKPCRPAGHAGPSPQPDGGSGYCHAPFDVGVNGVWVPGQWVEKKKYKQRIQKVGTFSIRLCHTGIWPGLHPAPSWVGFCP